MSVQREHQLNLCCQAALLLGLNAYVMKTASFTSELNHSRSGTVGSVIFVIIAGASGVLAAAEQVNSSPEDDTSLQIKADYET